MNQPATVGRGASSIEWTEATWNPVTGCSKVSPGCAHCYAETISLRFHRSVGPWTPQNAAENVVLHPDRLDQPLRWRKPRVVFVNSMSDLFHEQVPDEFIGAVFAVMAMAPQHTFQVLTKRPERMRAVLNDPRLPGLVEAAVDRAILEGWAPRQLAMQGAFRANAPWPLPNVWLGVSIENRRFVHRADVLRETPAAVRFISAEPLIGPLLFDYYRSERPDWDGPHPPKWMWCDGHAGPQLDLADIDWVIIGGESGPKARPMRLEWARALRDACACGLCGFERSDDCDFCATRLYRSPALFVKQLGSVLARELGSADRKGGDPAFWPADLRVREMPEVR